MEETSSWHISVCFLYQIKELGILFFPRRYNLMSENILDQENKFTYELLYISLLNSGPYTGKCLTPGHSETIGKSHDYNDYFAL